MLAAAFGREITDALDLVGRLSVLGGVLGWILAHVGTLASGKAVNVERWMLNGAGGGGVMGILVAIVDFLL